MRWIALLLPVLAGLVFASGCSLKSDRSSGLRVKLAPLARRTPNLFESLKLGLTSADDVTDLSCFAVNISGGGIATSSACEGELEIGVFDGGRAGIDSVFSAVVPLNDGLTFEAFGTAGGCSTLGNGFGADEAVYRIGRLESLSAGALDKPIVIPVSLDPSEAFSCSNVQPELVFSDSFSYGGGALDAVSGGVWLASPVTNFNIAGGQISFNPGGGASVMNVLASSLTPSLAVPFTKQSMTMNATGVNAGGTPARLIYNPDNLQIPPNAGYSTGFYCQAKYLASATTMDVEIFDGLGNSIASVETGLVSGGALTFNCEVNYVDSDTVELTAEVFNSSGVSELSTTSSPQPAANLGPVLGMAITGSPGDNVSITNYSIKQSDIPEP